MKRECNYDFLRCICALMIIVLHMGAFYQQSDIAAYEVIGTFCQAVTRTAVPCFVMLSGAFLLGDQRWQHYKFALEKTGKVMLWPTAAYSLFFMGISFLTYSLGISKASYIEVIKLSLEGYPYPHMWYMFMCTGLYFITPLLWKLKIEFQEIGKHAYYYLLMILLMLGCVVQGTSQLIWVIKFVPYIGYFMAGDFIHQCYNKMEKKKISWAALGIWIGFISFSCWVQIFNPELKYWGGLHTDPLNPVVMIASVGCFLFFSSLTVKFDTFFLAKHTGRIYLIHIIPMQTVKVLMEKFNGGILLRPVIGLPLMFTVTLVLSLIYALTITYIEQLSHMKIGKT